MAWTGTGLFECLLRGSADTPWHYELSWRSTTSRKCNFFFRKKISYTDRYDFRSYDAPIKERGLLFEVGCG